MDLRSLINKIDVLNEQVANPYKTDADRAKFDSLTQADQEWLTAGGGVPDINDEFILGRAPNKGQPDPQKAQQQAPAQAAQPADALADKIAKLNQLVVQLQTPTPAAAPAPSKPAVQPTAGQAAQPTTPEAPGEFTFTKKDGSKLTINKDGKPLQESVIAKSLVESFGYTLNEEPAGTIGAIPTVGSAAGAGLAKKFAGKTAGKLIPGAGTTLNAIDAYNRWQEGDRSGAVISTLAGIGWLVPGPLGWAIGGGLDAANLARDYKAGKLDGVLGDEEPASAQAAQPATKGDPKVVALQKYLVSQGAKNIDGTPLKVDGIVGKNTRAAMDAAGLQESLDEAWINPAAIKGAVSAAKNIGKNLGAGLKGRGIVQPMVKQARGGALAGKVAPGARTAHKIGSTIAKYPKTAAAAGIAAGAAAGLGFGGGEEPQATASAAGRKGQGQAAQPTQATAQSPCAGKEETIKQIQSIVADLKTSKDPKAAAAIASAEKALSACSGQAAQPADNSTPLERFYTGKRRAGDV